MPITINGSGTVTGISAGGLPDGVITTDDIAAGAVTTAKLTGGPAFIAYKSGSNQAITANVSTKVTYATEVFDTANCYDTSTSRFTPNIAGFYQVSANAESLAVAANYYVCNILKNGNSYATGSNFPTSSSAGPNSVVSALIYFNGSTDYVEVFAQCSANATLVASASETGAAKFSAFLARPA